MLIEIHNRIPIGLAVGFSIFPPDEENEEYFVILYLLIIEIRLDILWFVSISLRFIAI